MSNHLSDFLRSLQPGLEPEKEAYEDAREALRRQLHRELRRRGLWLSPPRYLGILGERWPGDALEELVSECYIAICIDRLPSLMNQILAGNDIDGLLARCVKNFVHDRQRGNDPLGYRLYQLITAALSRLAERGMVRWRPTGKIFNQTVCSFGDFPETVEATDLSVPIQCLNDDLWPQIIFAQGAARSGLEPRLDHHLAGLEATVNAFAFRDLIEPLKHDTRARWRQAAGAELERWATPERHDDLYDLANCVQQHIERQDPEDRRPLQHLWSFLFDYALGANTDAVIEKAESSGKPPTQLGLEKALGLSRHRIAGLKRELGKMIEDCGFAVSKDGGVSRRRKERSASMDRDEKLRTATAHAADSWFAKRADIESSTRPTQLGDLIVLPAHPDQLVEWLLVERRQDGQVSMLAVDTRPLAGSLDVPISTEPGGVACVRCAIEARAPFNAVTSAHRTGSLPDDVLAEVIKTWRPSQDSNAAIERQDVDEDPHYRDHLKELEALSQDLAAALNRVHEPTREIPRRQSRPRLSRQAAKKALLALAALLLLSLSGLAIWQRDQISKLESLLEPVPSVNLPFVWLSAEEPPRGREDALFIPLEAKRLAIVLEVSSTEAHPLYRVEIETKTPRRLVWSSDILVKHDSELSFDLPASLLSSAEYEIRIYGLRIVDQPARLETYTLWIEVEE